MKSYSNRKPTNWRSIGRGILFLIGILFTGYIISLFIPILGPPTFIFWVILGLMITAIFLIVVGYHCGRCFAALRKRGKLGAVSIFGITLTILGIFTGGIASIYTILTRYQNNAKGTWVNINDDPFQQILFASLALMLLLYPFMFALNSDTAVEDLVERSSP
jgi:hypothetical protein